MLQLSLAGGKNLQLSIAAFENLVHMPDSEGRIRVKSFLLRRFDGFAMVLEEP